MRAPCQALAERGQGRGAEGKRMSFGVTLLEDLVTWVGPHVHPEPVTVARAQ